MPKIKLFHEENNKTVLPIKNICCAYHFGFYEKSEHYEKNITFLSFVNLTTSIPSRMYASYQSAHALSKASPIHQIERLFMKFLCRCQLTIALNFHP